MVAYASNEVARPEVPSVRLRALKATTLLIGFYLLNIALVLVLLAAPIVGTWAALGPVGASVPTIQLALAFACTWIPAGLLIRGLFRVRRPRFIAPGRRLETKDAPALFAMLEELGVQAGTAPPEDVYLSPFPNVGVAETGGTYGVGSRRVLVLGIPVLHWLTVQEVRAVLAHELGHYLGGDTKLSGIIGYCESSFREVLGSMRDTTGGKDHYLYAAGRSVADSIGKFILGGYARLYLRVVRADGRRQERAADALSVRLAGRAAAAGALEKLSFMGPIYEVYLNSDVRRAVLYGALPSDLLEGFEALRAHLRALGTEAKVVESVRAEKTDPYDNHPALSDRVEAMQSVPEADVDGDDRTALELVSDRGMLDAALLSATGSAFVPVGVPNRAKKIPWARLMSEVVAPTMLREATKLAASLRPLYPHATSPTSMFAAVARGLAAGGAQALVFQLSPDLKKADPHSQIAAGNVIGLHAIVVLFLGALVERGAEVQAPFGEKAFALYFGGGRVAVGELATAAMRHPQGAQQLAWWGEHLESGERLANATQMSADHAPTSSFATTGA